MRLAPRGASFISARAGLKTAHPRTCRSGFDRGNTDGWLDLFSVIMNPPEDKMEKAAMVLDRAMSNPRTVRYRDFYSRSTS